MSDSPLGESGQQGEFVDSNVLIYAVRFGCAVLWSEDLNAGQIYDGVGVLNPFEAEASTADSRIS